VTERQLDRDHIAAERDEPAGQKCLSGRGAGQRSGLHSFMFSANDGRTCLMWEPVTLSDEEPTLLARELILDVTHEDLPERLGQDARSDPYLGARISMPRSP
jgi:hypothetical protein